MGSSGSRPSCLGEKSRPSEDFLKDSYLRDLGLAAGHSVARNNAEGRAGPPEKPSRSPTVIENGWSVAPGAPSKSRPGSPLPKRNSADGQVQDGSCSRPQGPQEAGWSPLRSGPGSWVWKPLTTTEVTEVTEVTETIVTEIVEVTEYPGGDKSQEPLVTRTVRVLTECAGALMPEAAASLGGPWGAETETETLEKVLAWIRDMEELGATQKPPSSEAEVVKAQLQEQKLLRRLLGERRAPVERLLREGQWEPPETAASADGCGSRTGLPALQEKWTALVEGAEARHRALERILPAACAFRESGDAFREWLGRAEGELAQLWRGSRSLSGHPEAQQQLQALCEEIRTKPSELERALEHGDRLLELVAGEEARLVQEKMDSLRTRFLVVGQNSADMQQHAEQASGAACWLDPTQEELAVWLGHLEKELPPQGGRPGDGPGPGAAADQEKFEQALRSALAKASHLSAQLEEQGHVCLDAHAVRAQLHVQKLLSAEILHHQGLVERLVAIAGRLLGLGSSGLQEQQQEPPPQALLQPLKESVECLVRRSSARTTRLEHAQHLLAQYAEAHEELEPWLAETQRAVASLPPDGEGQGAFREQQELLQALWEAVAEHKPLMSRMEHAVGQLAELSPGEAAPFLRGWRAAEERYSRVRERVRRAAAVLQEAIPRYSQLSERVELMAGCLERLQSRMQPPPAMRGDAAWLREQIRENGLRLAELEKLGVTLETLRGQREELLATVPASASQAIHGRVEQLQGQWEALWKLGEEREAWLRGLLALAEPFWQGLSELAVALGDIQQVLLEPQEVGPDAPAIQARLGAMQALREELDTVQTELDSLGALGVELVSSCGDLDKPDVAKGLDDLYVLWNSLSKVWAERQNRLEEQLQASVAHQEAVERLAGWLESAELRVAGRFLVGADLEVLEQQLLDLKARRLRSLRDRWNLLEEEVVNRQHGLEAALLGLGQVQSQLEELLQWLLHTAEGLRGPPDLSLDLQRCEIELAKHKVLRNDVLSRARTVRSVQEAGQRVLLTSAGDSAEGLQGRLQQLGQRWDFVLHRTESRQLELEGNLGQVREITREATGLLQWLEQLGVQLSFSRPLWGHAEAATDSLAAHVALCEEMDAKQPAYDAARDKLRRLLGSRPLPGASGLEHSLRMLEQKWASVAGQLREQKERLSEGLTAAAELHAGAQALLGGLGQLEEALGALPPPSYVLERVTGQIQEQQALARDCQAHKEALAGLEAVAARVEDFGRGQDGSLARGLVLTAKERLAGALQRVAERAGELEEARKCAEQFSDSWQLLRDWLEDAGLACEAPSQAALNQEGIKARLAEHKEFQRGLRAKRPAYEATLRSGRLLLQRARHPDDAPRLQEGLAELKERWGAVCGWAAERQRKLEERLLFCGHVTDALQTLLEWLYQAEPQLAEGAPVAGDRDLVALLLDKHKVFQKELDQRASCIQTLRHAMHGLSPGPSAGESPWLQRQVEELGRRWELVSQLSVSRRDRLEAALRQASRRGGGQGAEEFHTLLHPFLSRLSELERSLPCRSPPEDEGAVRECQSRLKVRQGLLPGDCAALRGACGPQSRVILRAQSIRASVRQGLRESLQCQELELQCICSLGEEILSCCHPDSAITIRSWVTVARSRFQEVSGWAQQQDERLQAQMATLAAKQEEVARLFDWVAAAEESLSLRDREPLPEDAEQLEELSSQHALAHRWQQLWLAALDRQYRLQHSRQRLQELEEFSHFDFTVWRKRYLQWIGHRKSRVLDVFRGIDRDQDGRITQQEFVDGVLSSKFPTNTLEMSAVAGIFDNNRDGFIDYYEFASALHPSRDALRRTADTDRIQDEVDRQVAQCSCARQFQVEQISANRYRFGESQQLRMVRILRSTLMVRVGGGWIALDEFLVKNDPCRVKGRTNMKINEKYLSADPGGAKGASGQPAPASKGLPPSRSSSSLSLCSSASAPSSPLARKARPPGSPLDDHSGSIL
ncbi:Microtubule-actin cross-linking factor 1, isoforms 1/2/3/5 [Varanus komodoensis]|nr:Microtubule-actin cross-linking factor 1, isoforms 1/2/3/5 [Varanus komodoensis]